LMRKMFDVIGCIGFSVQMTGDRGGGGTINRFMGSTMLSQKEKKKNGGGRGRGPRNRFGGVVLLKGDAT